LLAYRLAENYLETHADESLGMMRWLPFTITQLKQIPCSDIIDYTHPQLNSMLQKTHAAPVASVEGTLSV